MANQFNLLSIASFEDGPIGSFQISADSFTDSYTADWGERADAGVPHPNYYHYSGGRFQPFSVELLIVAGVSARVQDSSDVLRICNQIVSLALPRKAGDEPSSLVTVRIGQWFVRHGHVSNVQIEFRRPWDVLGNPMAARITFELVPWAYKNTSGGGARYAWPLKPFSYNQDVQQGWFRYSNPVAKKLEA